MCIRTLIKNNDYVYVVRRWIPAGMTDIGFRPDQLFMDQEIDIIESVWTSFEDAVRIAKGRAESTLVNMNPSEYGGKYAEIVTDTYNNVPYRFSIVIKDSGCFNIISGNSDTVYICFSVSSYRVNDPQCWLFDIE